MYTFSSYLTLLWLWNNLALDSYDLCTVVWGQMRTYIVECIYIPCPWYLYRIHKSSFYRISGSPYISNSAFSAVSQFPRLHIGCSLVQVIKGARNFRCVGLATVFYLWMNKVLTKENPLYFKRLLSLTYTFLDHMGQVTKLWLSCYLFLLSIDSKTR